MNFLTSVEPDWILAGRLVDVLRELASFGKLALPDLPASQIPRRKRLWPFEQSPTTQTAASTPAASDSETSSESEPYLRLIAKLKAKAPRSPSNHAFPTPVGISGNPQSSSSPAAIPIPEAFTHFDSLETGSATFSLSGQGHDLFLFGADGQLAMQQLPDILLDNASSRVDMSSDVYTSALPFTPTLSQWHQPTSHDPPNTESLETSDLNAFSGLLGGGSTLAADPLPLNEDDEFKLWQDVPGGFEWEHWSDYISNMHATLLSPDNSGEASLQPF